MHNFKYIQLKKCILLLRIIKARKDFTRKNSESRLYVHIDETDNHIMSTNGIQD